MADRFEDEESGVTQIVSIIGPWVAYTPTFVGFGAVTDVGTFYWRQVGESIEVEGRYSVATSTAVIASISLPVGLTAAPQGSFTGTRGRWTRLQNAAANRKEGVMLFTNASNLVQFANVDYTTAVAPTTALNGNAIATSEIVEISFTVPITGWVASVAQGAGLATGQKAGTVFRTAQTPLTVTCPQTGFTVIRAVGVAYMDNNGVWRMTFNVAATYTSATISNLALTIAGTIFKAIANFYQPLAGMLSGGGTSPALTQCFADQNSGILRLSCPSTATMSSVQFSGDVELDSKPSWA